MGGLFLPKWRLHGCYHQEEYNGTFVQDVPGHPRSLGARKADSCPMPCSKGLGRGRQFGYFLVLRGFHLVDAFQNAFGKGEWGLILVIKKELGLRVRPTFFSQAELLLNRCGREWQLGSEGLSLRRLSVRIDLFRAIESSI